MDIRTDIDYTLLDNDRQPYDPPIGILGGENILDRIRQAIQDEYSTVVSRIEVIDTAYTLNVWFGDDTDGEPAGTLTLIRIFNY